MRKVFVNQAVARKYAGGIIIVAAENIDEANKLISDYVKEYCWHDDFFKLDCTEESNLLQTNVTSSRILYDKIYEE